MATDLGSVCPIRDGSVADAVQGVQPSLVARPTSTEQVSDLLSACHRDDRAVVVRGAGTKQGWSNPPERLDVVIDTGGMNRLVAHEHGDLIATAGAGMGLPDLAPRLAAADQQLVIDDLVGDSAVGGSTVGGAIATNLSGPRRMWVGSTRDLLIGVTIVRADGAVANAGGKVVKNVAGYDLCKLISGSYGTLGVITEATFRLHPIPPADRWVTVTVPVGELDEALSIPLHSQLAPAALEVRADAGSEHAEVAVLLSGTDGGVAGRAEALSRDWAGHTTEEKPSWVGRLPHEPGHHAAAGRPAEHVTIKLSAQLSSVAELTRRASAAGVSVSGSAGTGVLYGTMPRESAAEAIDSLRPWCVAHGGSLVVLDCPPEALRTSHGATDRWGTVAGIDVMRRIKHEFDPTRILAPGRFVGGL